MKAFVEILSGIVRVGPSCSKYGDPFDGSVAFSSVDGKTVVLKALSTGTKITPSHIKAIITALQEFGLTPTWIRIKNNAGCLETVPERPHKPTQEGASPSPATNE